jgi:hypothetical protein
MAYAKIVTDYMAQNSDKSHLLSSTRQSALRVCSAL